MKAQSDGAGTQAPWPARSAVSRTELDPVSFLHRSATVPPERIAVVDGDRRWTYSELRERVNRVASALRGSGLERHDRVAALCPNVPALLELHHAWTTIGKPVDDMARNASRVASSPGAAPTRAGGGRSASAPRAAGRFRRSCHR